MVKNPGKFVYAIDVPVRWCDMDAFGHVNNSVYLTYFELARIAWWDAITPAGTVFTDVGPVIIDSHCTYFKTITYPETLHIKLSVGPAGRSSHECYYDIFSKKDPTVLYASGSTKVVWVNRQLERSVPLPPYVLLHLPEKT